MDEYKFQHEGDSSLRKTALDAVNRSLWLGRWHRTLEDVKGTRIGVATAAAVLTLFYFIPIPDDFSFYSILSYGLLAFVFFMSIRGWSTKSRSKERQDELAKPESITKIQNRLFYAGIALSVLFHHWIPRLWFYLPAVLFTLIWDWHNLRKLRKNLIAWGVLEPDGSPTVLCNSPQSALKDSTEQMDAILTPVPITTRQSDNIRKTV